MYFKIIPFLSALFLSITLQAKPNEIILIRHGEKIDDSYNDLSPQGCQRAYQLPLFFSRFENITAIYAQQPKNSKGSIRALETVAPFAYEQQIKIENKYKKEEISALVKEINSREDLNNKTVVIAWEHSMIPEIAKLFVGQIDSRLEKWPGFIFDQAWVIQFVSDKQAQLDILAENILPTDVDQAHSGVENWGQQFPTVENGIQVPTAVIQECESGNKLLDKKMRSQLRYGL